ncbi:MAG: LAGLIDADG family homing endonuclease [Halobacteriota archaeon]
MAQAGNQELTERFIQFYRGYYRDAIGDLAQHYPNEQRSLFVDYDDLYRFDPNLAEDYRSKPDQLREYAEEGLRLFDLPADVKLGNAHVRVENLPQTVDIRDIRVHDDHIGKLVAVQGIVRKATDVRPKITQAAFECQRCGTMTYIPQTEGSFQEPHECQGCERQGPFRINFDQSEFIDAQKVRVQESPEGLRGGETPQSIDVNVEDDITGNVTPGDHVTVTGVLHIEQMSSGQEKSSLFDLYMDGVSITLEDEEFENMDITAEDVEEIVELSSDPDIYQRMVDSVAPSIYGYDEEKLAMILQLFSGVTKHLPDGSRIRGDLHMLLIGDPGTGKCVSGDTTVTLADGSEVPIRELVEANLDDPKPIDDGVWDEVDFEVPSLRRDGSVGPQRAVKVWKRQAPEKMYRVRTSTGYEVEVTPSHPLFIQSDGRFEPVATENLSEGDFIAVPRMLPIEGEDALDNRYRHAEASNAGRLSLPERWTPRLARLLGYIVAEGYVDSREDHTGVVSIPNNDEATLRDAAAAFDELGVDCTTRVAHPGTDATELMCSSGEFVSFLVELDHRLLEPSTERSVPPALLRASPRIKAAFLKAYIERAGHVSASQREISIASMRRELPENVRSLLLSLGISSQLSERHNGRYRLRISGEQFERYRERVGFVTGRKSKAKSTHDGTSVNTTPDVVSDGGVDSLASGLQASRQLTEGAIGWDRIETIEPFEPDEEWVYDLEIEDTHNYLTNNIVSHNSQMLSYIRHIAPRSVYTSGKGSSSAGLTAAAVRDDFGDGQQWTLEAGALVLADKGIAAVDELDKMRCVTGDTLVHLGDGRIKRIEDIAREAALDGTIEELPNGRTIRDVDLEAWTMTKRGRLVRQPITAVHQYDAPAELTEVSVETGESLTSTHDHPFFVFEDGELVERPAAELRPGDWVYVPRRLPSPATDGGSVTTTGPAEAPTARDPEIALGSVLGYLSGVGNVDYNREAGSYEVRFTNKEASVRSDFERACRIAFGVDPVRHPSDRRDDGVETVRLRGQRVADTVIAAGMNREPYDTTTFPDGVTDLSRPAKAAFVRAFVDSGGCVDTARGNVKLFSASYELLLGTKSLLLEFGVSSQIQHRERAEKRDLYALAITSAESLDAFRTHIGCTLDRNRRALETVCDGAFGDRTTIDVSPSIGPALASLRQSLRLRQSECGLDVVTDGDFERGKANRSIHSAQIVLAAFEARKRDARKDRDSLSTNDSWNALERLKDKYHVSQAELAEGTKHTQQEISREWGDSEKLRQLVRDRLKAIVEDVAETDISALRELIRGDVTWRCVESVTSVSASSSDDRIAVLQGELAALTGTTESDAVNAARRMLSRDIEPDSWDTLRDELTRYNIPLQTLANDLHVAGATVSRWFNGIDETARFDAVRNAAVDRITERRRRIASLVDEIEARGETNVYDLTVDGTHNFVANGMVVHNSEDRSAMHQALEQQQISVNKAGINATLKSRCSLLGAANPKYGRFDQYEPIGEQIDLEPALISRFDLIFTVTDQPDPDHDSKLAEHILKTNYAGELNTQRERLATSEFTKEQVDDVTEEVAPDIDAELLRKYIAHAKRSCYPTMTDEAKQAIRDFYVDLRSKGADEDAPVPVTARKLEGLVRLAEASARIRLSDQVEAVDAERVIEIVRSSLQDIGIDPETGEFDADVVETGTSKSQRDRIKNLKGLIAEIETEYEDGAPIDEILERASEIGLNPTKAEGEIEKLRRKGEVYEPRQDHLRTT